jgi:hypothetical protein
VESKRIEEGYKDQSEKGPLLCSEKAKAKTNDTKLTVMSAWFCVEAFIMGALVFSMCYVLSLPEATSYLPINYMGILCRAIAV